MLSLSNRTRFCARHGMALHGEPGWMLCILWLCAILIVSKASAQGHAASGWIDIDSAMQRSPRGVVVETGRTAPGDAIVRDVYLKNSSDSQLHINSVRASCSCASPFVPDSVLEPGSEAMLRFQVLPNPEERGIVQRSFLVTFADRPAPLPVIVRAVIAGDIRIAPRYTEVPYRSDDDCTVFRFTVSSETGVPVSALSVHAIAFDHSIDSVLQDAVRGLPADIGWLADSVHGNTHDAQNILEIVVRGRISTFLTGEVMFRRGADTERARFSFNPRIQQLYRQDDQ